MSANCDIMYASHLEREITLVIIDLQGCDKIDNFSTWVRILIWKIKAEAATKNVPKEGKLGSKIKTWMRTMNENSEEFVSVYQFTYAINLTWPISITYLHAVILIIPQTHFKWSSSQPNVMPWKKKEKIDFSAPLDLPN